MISLVVGLGNIGNRYQKTRHNLGFDVIDQVLKESKTSKHVSFEDYDSFELEFGVGELILAKPTTMMNGSGYAVKHMLGKFSLDPSELLVISDDFNIPLGAIRFRQEGSAGGHNGLESVISELQTESFPRLRLGIGPLPEDRDVIDFVLEEFTSEQRKKVDKMIEIAAEAVIFAAGHRFEETMSKYNYNPV